MSNSNSQQNDESILESMPQSSQAPTTSKDHSSKPDAKIPSAENRFDKPPNDDGTFQKWDLKDWEEDTFETDERNSSLPVVMKIANQLSYLKELLELYKKFNVHLGCIVSGRRHKGLLADIFSTVDRLGFYTKRLRYLRNEKQRGTVEPYELEVVATDISDRFKAREDKVWDVFDRKVDMVNVTQRDAYLEKKGEVLKDVMGWALSELDKKDAKDERWKEKEVQDMKDRWEGRWKTYAAMDPEDLKELGWIMDG